MVRLTLLIVGLLGMFLLNACGGYNAGPKQLDNRAAIFDENRTGGFDGKARSEKVTEVTEDNKVVYVDQNKIFDDVDMSVNWDAKTVKIKAKIIDPKTGKSDKSKEIVYEGAFQTNGVAILKPSDKSLKTKAGVRCNEECAELVADLGVTREVDGKPTLVQQQFKVIDPNFEKINQKIQEKYKEDEEKRKALMDNEEIDPAGSNVAAPPKKTEPSKGKYDFTKVKGSVVGDDEIVTEPSKKNAKNPVVKSDPKKTADVKKDDKKSDKKNAASDDFDDSKIEKEEGTPILILPSVLNEEIMDDDGENISFDKYSPSVLFPYDLGPKYSGQARGFYSSAVPRELIGKIKGGTLINGTDVAVDADESTTDAKGNPKINVWIKKFGFASVDRVDEKKYVYYGSGLLVKMIEEVGKQYTTETHGDFFEVNDLSKKGGGKIRPHASHQNGLDADIRIPVTAGKQDYKKVWHIINDFVKFGFVDVILLDQTRTNQLCKYLQANEKDYQSTFKHLYDGPGHDTHLHVRLKCTNHNIGCYPATYTQSKFASCK